MEYRSIYHEKNRKSEEFRRTKYFRYEGHAEQKRAGTYRSKSEARCCRALHRPGRMRCIHPGSSDAIHPASEHDEQQPAHLGTLRRT